VNLYRLERREDKNIWVTIQPLMADIQKHFDNLHDMDTSEFTDQDRELLDLKIVGLRAIYEFLGALKLEHELKELRDQNEIERQISEGTQLMERVLQ
jgi:hypothetical protein